MKQEKTINLGSTNLYGEKYSPTRSTKLSKYRIHESIRRKVEYNDSELPDLKELIDSRFIFDESGIRIIKNKIYFDKLNPLFTYLKRWSIMDYIEYYMYITQRCKCIKVRRNGVYVTLNVNNITDDECKILEIMSNGLRKIESIVSDYYEESNVSYNSLFPKGYTDFYLPLKKR